MKTELLQELDKLIARGLTFADANTAFADHADKHEPKDVPYRKAAQKLYSKQGELEIDDNAIVSTPDNESGGAYVQAWVWVGDEDLPPMTSRPAL